MAEKKEAAAAPENAIAPAAIPNNKKLIAIAAMMLVLGGAAGGGFLWWKQKHDAKHKPKEQHADPHNLNKDKLQPHSEEVIEDEEGKPPIFMPLEKNVVKLQRGKLSVDHYLQVSIELRIADQAVANKLKQNFPIIQYEVMLILSSKEFEWMDPMENKKKLALEIRDRINAIIKAESAKEGIRAVYFTTFILQ